MLVGSDSRRVSVTRSTEPARRIRASVSGVSIGKELRPRRRAGATRARGSHLRAAVQPRGAPRRPKRSACGRGGLDARLPGAGHAGLPDRILDGEAGVAGFRLRPQAPRYGVEEAAHESHVRVVRVQLCLDAIDGFDQIFLIADGEGHARDGMLNGNQRLMYCGGLTPIHGREFEPVCGKPQALPRAVVMGVRGRRVDGLRKLIDWLRKQRSPALWAGLRNQSTRAYGLLGGLLRLLRAFSRLGGLLVMLLVRGLGRGRGLLGGRRGGRRISGNNRTREQGQGNDWDELLEH